MPITRMAVKETKWRTLMQIAFYYTRCTDVYSLLTYVSVHLPAQLCKQLGSVSNRLLA